MKYNRTIGGLLASLVLGTVGAMMPAASFATDTNDPDHWENQPGEVCVKVDDKGTEAGGYTVRAEPAGRNWSTLIIKKGSGADQNDVVENPVAGQTYFWHGQNKGYSHIILCSIPEPATPTDACPNMPGDQAPGTACSTTDACPNMPGNQAPGTACSTTDACPNMPGDQAPGTACTTAPPVAPGDTGSDIEVLGDSAGKAVGTLRVSCQGTVRVTMHNRSSERATYTVRIAKRKHSVAVGAEKTRRWVTTAQPRQRAQLWQGGRLLATKRLPRACVAPAVLPDTGLRA